MTDKKNNGGWIGVDLDGTLAEYGWETGLNVVGRPILPMLERVRRWIELGITVKIFTARAGYPELIPPIHAWLKSLGLPELEVTATKDFQMIKLYDDRCVQIEPNTGRILGYDPDEEPAFINLVERRQKRR